jgi:hypothetical protein
MDTAGELRRAASSELTEDMDILSAESKRSSEPSSSVRGRCKADKDEESARLNMYLKGHTKL